MELEGSDVVIYLSGYGTVRNGSLVSLFFRNVATSPVLELVFDVPSNDKVRVVKLELREIQEFDYSYTSQNPPGVIAFVKCFMNENGEFYLSLDPYDERDLFISEKDCEFFRSKFVRLIAYDQTCPPSELT